MLNIIIIIIVSLVVGKLPVDWSSHRDVSAVFRLSEEQSIIHSSLHLDFNRTAFTDFVPACVMF